jgi:hypothetical protein
VRNCRLRVSSSASAAARETPGRSRPATLTLYAAGSQLPSPPFASICRSTGSGTKSATGDCGGGGISYLSYSRDFSQRSTGCDPASLCSDFSHEFGSGNLAAQVQAGLDVAVAPHVALMGQFRLVVAVDDPGFGHNSFVAGVRFGL